MMTVRLSSDMLTAALRDGMAAMQLLDQLSAAGEDNHPAAAHLRMVAEQATNRAQLNQIAAVAFAAAVRVDLARTHGSAIAAGHRPCELEPLLMQRRPLADEGGTTPFTALNWPLAATFAARAVTQGQFAPHSDIPGALTFDALRDSHADPAAFLAVILGDPVRDDKTDPAAIAGKHLAKLIPGYVDIDALLMAKRGLY